MAVAPLTCGASWKRALRFFSGRVPFEKDIVGTVLSRARQAFERSTPECRSRRPRRRDVLRPVDVGFFQQPANDKQRTQVQGGAGRRRVRFVLNLFSVCERGCLTTLLRLPFLPPLLCASALAATFFRCCSSPPPCYLPAVAIKSCAKENVVQGGSWSWWQHQGEHRRPCRHQRRPGSRNARWRRFFTRTSTTSAAARLSTSTPQSKRLLHSTIRSFPGKESSTFFLEIVYRQVYPFEGKCTPRKMSHLCPAERQRLLLVIVHRCPLLTKHLPRCRRYDSTSGDVTSFLFFALLGYFCTGDRSIILTSTLCPLHALPE